MLFPSIAEEQITPRFAIPPIYEQAEDFSEGIAAVYQDKKWKFIDQHGAKLVPFVYDKVKGFKNSMVAV